MYGHPDALRHTPSLSLSSNTLMQEQVTKEVLYLPILGQITDLYWENEI